MKTLYMIAAILIVSMTTSYAQNIQTDNLNWNATKATDKLNGGDVVYNCTLRTHAGQSVDWIQNDDTVYHYSITQTNGTWSSVTSDGTITYQITAAGGLTGTYTFSRSAGVITVRLTTSTNGQTDLDLLFSISDVQPAQ